MLRPLGKNILVKMKLREKKPSIILTNPDPNKPFHATVIDIGTKADLDIQPGDTLLLVPFAGSKISAEEDGYLLVTERDILGVDNG